jgi:hypothetical protein
LKIVVASDKLPLIYELLQKMNRWNNAPGTIKAVIKILGEVSEDVAKDVIRLVGQQHELVFNFKS